MVPGPSSAGHQKATVRQIRTLSGPVCGAAGRPPESAPALAMPLRRDAVSPPPWPDAVASCPGGTRSGNSQQGRTCGAGFNPDKETSLGGISSDDRAPVLSQPCPLGQGDGLNILSAMTPPLISTSHTLFHVTHADTLFTSGWLFARCTYMYRCTYSTSDIFIPFPPDPFFPRHLLRRATL